MARPFMAAGDKLKMIADFNVTPDPKKRTAMVNKIDKYLQDNAWPMMPLYRSAVRWLRWDYLRGRFFMGGSINTFDDRIWLKSHAPGRN